jgi:putative hydrolase of the HAD superfamily
MAAKALIVDFGGVLTTSIWPAFAQFCESEGLEADTVLKLFRGDSEALRLLRRLETGEIDSDEFEPAFGRLLGVADHEDLTQRLFAGLRPDERMIGAVHAARAAGVKTGLITNSWGMGIYERAPLDLFDERVISGEVGMHKPQPEIYLLACERLEVEPAEAVFVDDLRENVEGAEAVGMAAVLHRESEKTIAKLEELLAVSLRPPPSSQPAPGGRGGPVPPPRTARRR